MTTTDKAMKITERMARKKLAETLGMSEPTMRKRLNSSRPWKPGEKIIIDNLYNAMML